MATARLKDMDVDALIALRADVEKALTEWGRDLQRQLALLGNEAGKRRGRPPVMVARASAMKGVKVPPKYRGPGGETWAGRGATPRWLDALLKEGHSIEEYAIGKGGKRAAATAKKPSPKKGRKSAPRKRTRKIAVAKETA